MPVSTGMYGPAVGEFYHDAMFGPKGNKLGPNDVALSPDWLKQYPLGSQVPVDGHSYNVGDVSYRRPGQPNTNMIEFRSGNHPATVEIGPNSQSISPAALRDFNRANDTYGEGGWYYDNNGNPVSNTPASMLGGDGSTNSLGIYHSPNDVLDGTLGKVAGFVPYLGPATKIANLAWKVGGSVGNLFKHHGQGSSPNPDDQGWAPAGDPQSHTNDTGEPPSSGAGYTGRLPNGQWVNNGLINTHPIDPLAIPGGGSFSQSGDGLNAGGVFNGNDAAWKPMSPAMVNGLYKGSGWERLLNNMKDGRNTGTDSYRQAMQDAQQNWDAYQSDPQAYHAQWIADHPNMSQGSSDSARGDRPQGSAARGIPMRQGK